MAWQALSDKQTSHRLDQWQAVAELESPKPSIFRKLNIPAGGGLFQHVCFNGDFFHISGIFVGCICASNFLNGRKTFLLFKFLFSCLITLKENNLTVLFSSYI